MADVMKKICMFGDPYVGKTSLIRRFVTGKYDDSYLSTLGTVVAKKTVRTENDDTTTMMIWDVSGQKEFKRVHASAFQFAKGAIAVCDVTRPQTAENLSTWMDTIKTFAGSEVPIVIFVNKLDLIENDEVALDTVLRMLEPHGYDILTTSAKTGDNVEEAFMMLAHMMSPTKPEPKKETIVADKGTPDSPLSFLDYMMYEFCEAYGDTEMGMHMIRKQARDARIDISKPSTQDLERLSERLVKLVEESKGEYAASNLKSEFIRAKDGTRWTP